MSAPQIRDPAVLDRRSVAIAGLDPVTLPRRTMKISGLEGSLDAVILSKDQKGPATRLVSFPAGWGTGVSGAFTADVEIFVLEGELSIAGAVVGPNGYVAVNQGGVFGGLRGVVAGRALVMTAAPVRFDTASGGRAADLVMTRSAELPWEPDPASSARFTKRLKPDGSAVLVGLLEWNAAAGDRHSHDVGEEIFVVDGEATFVDVLDGNPATHTYGRDGYVWRPPGSVHGGEGSAVSDTALLFVRRPGGPGITTAAADSVEGVPEAG